MDTREKLIDARIGMLALADEWKNISRACQLAGISRTHYYNIKEAFERYGRDGLAPTVRRRPRMPNETPPELVASHPGDDGRIPDLQLRPALAAAAAHRCPGQRRPGAGRLGSRGSGQALRPAALAGAPGGGVGTLKGVGRVYALTFIDANAAVGFAKLYLSKVPMTAVDLLHDRVLPCYDAHGVALARVLTDNGREYCGRPLTHPFELSCTVQQIEHRTTRVSSPESNGMVERFNRTLKEEFFAVAYRKRIYETVEALQADLDAFLAFYNEGRAHQGYRTQGRTPYQTFLEHQRAAEAPQAA